MTFEPISKKKRKNFCKNINYIDKMFSSVVYDHISVSKESYLRWLNGETVPDFKGRSGLCNFFKVTEFEIFCISPWRFKIYFRKHLANLVEEGK